MGIVAGALYSAKIITASEMAGGLGTLPLAHHPRRPRLHRARHLPRRLAHRPHHGIAHYQAQTSRRLLRRDGGCDHAVCDRARRNSRQHHPHHHRRHRRSGRDAPASPPSAGESLAASCGPGCSPFPPPPGSRRLPIGSSDSLSGAYPAAQTTRKIPRPNPPPGHIRACGTLSPLHHSQEDPHV